MSIFTSKKVKWRRAMQEDVKSRGEFDQLERTMGRPGAKLFLETLYDKWTSTNQDLKHLTPDFVSYFMQKEREAYTSRKQYVDSLVLQSASGALGGILNANLRATADYYKNPLRGGMAGRDLAIDQAANWVCGTYAAALPATRALLERYIPAQGGHPGIMGMALGRTPQHLRAINRTLAPNAAPYRLITTQATKYPSTVGGNLLLEEIFGLTSGTNSWPAFGSADWESIAMFYLVSIVHVQGFSDGNKRTGHMAYAIALIKGTHSFKAPISSKENELFRMNA